MYGPYNNPESYGLTLIGSVEWTDEAYQFDMTAVWSDGTGSYYVADDSGCSCPMPFEDVTMSDLVPTTKALVIQGLIERMSLSPAGSEDATALMERMMSL